MLDWGKADRFIEGIYRKSHSTHSRHFYSFGIRKLKEFCDERHIRITQANLYEVLDEYVGWLDAKKLKPKTILDYMSSAKRFMVFCGLEIDEKKLRNRVSMPRVLKIAEEPLRIEQVKRLLTIGKPNVNMRGLILLLLSSGMRLSEALNLKVKELDLNAHPARASLRAEITKAKRARIAYMSDEARVAIEEVIHDAPPDRLMFGYSGDIWSRTKIATVNFRRVVERAGLGDKIEGHRIHKIHFHIFRKFFLTKGSDVIGEHAAHALCGHGFYMDTYYQKSEEEREADYLKLMPKLTVFGNEEFGKDEILAQFNRKYLEMAGYSEEEINDLETRLGDLSTLTTEGLKELIDVRSRQSLGLNGNHQKIVPMGEVENWVEQGWDFVTPLPNSKAIIRLPTQP